MVLLVLTTFADADTAASVAKSLVTERLAACGTVLPGARSIYRWQDAVEDTAECLLLLKTTPALQPALEERLRDLHPYDTPEILALPPADAFAPYADWVRQSCRE